MRKLYIVVLKLLGFNTIPESGLHIKARKYKKLNYYSRSESIRLRKWLFFIFLNITVSNAALADYTVPAGTNIDASALVGYSGVLTIYGTVNITSNVLLSGFTTVIINGPSGQIYWTNNSDLSFAAGTTFKINSSLGLQPATGNGNSSQRLLIGNAIISVSSDKSSISYFTFDQFNALGGLPRYNITSNSPVCEGSAVNLSIAPDKNVANISYSYSWYIYPVSGTFNSITAASVNITPAAGDYIIGCVTVANSYQTTTTVPVSVKKLNTWLGINSNWSSGANWCPVVPTSSTNIVIPATAVNPVISSTSFANNMIINTGATLTVSASGLLQIAGSITNNGTINATNGSLEFTGAASVQSIKSGGFTGQTIKNLKLDNTKGFSLQGSAISDTLNITGSLSFGASNVTFTTNDKLTLKSSAAGTASVADITNNGSNSGNSITGKVTVERNVNTGTGSGQHGKSWQLLSAPTNSSTTIKNSWMEGGATITGFGAWITGSSGTAGGFDAYSPAPAIKTYSSITDSWTPLGSPVTTTVHNDNGYMIFVRGDRTVVNAFGANSTAVPTILRSKGILLTGTLPPVSVLAGKYQTVGNPYAARVDFSKLSKTNIDNVFYLWDPLLYGSYGYGGYQTLSAANNFEPTVPNNLSAAYYKAGISYPYIESGQAFFVHNISGTNGSVTFTENSKAAGSLLLIRENNVSNKRQFFRSYLYNDAGDIVDGNSVVFDEGFSNTVDTDDAMKIMNSGENFGLRRDNKILAVEARSLIENKDTIYYNMVNFGRHTYHLHLAPQNMNRSGLLAFLIDNYLKTTTPVSLEDNTVADITVNSDSASAAPARLSIIFKSATPLPVSFTSIHAYAENGDVLLKWEVEDERNIMQYEIEKSLDGNTFTKLENVVATNGASNSYHWIDQNAAAGYNFYRIRSMDANGKAAYSEIVKAFIGNRISGIIVYPNPVKNGVVNLQFNQQPAGKYRIRIITESGEVVLSKVIMHEESSSTEIIRCGNFIKGICRVEITKISTTGNKPLSQHARVKKMVIF